MKYLIIAIFLSLFGNKVYAEKYPGTEVIANQPSALHVVWDRVPISFMVPIGQERMISFPGSVDFHNSDPHLTTDNVSIVNNAGTLYIHAKKAFEPIRVSVVLKKTGEVVLLDISATSHADQIPIEVVLPETVSIQNDKHPEHSLTQLHYVTLLRYAIQQLYAPERLLQENLAIQRTPMQTSKSVHLMRNDEVIAMPLISWRAGDGYVTAVLLKNVGKKIVPIDLRQIEGRWLAGSVYPLTSLDPEGKFHDRTTLFLVSSYPFNEALHKSNEVTA